jgi:hypothetical protein
VPPPWQAGQQAGSTPGAEQSQGSGAQEERPSWQEQLLQPSRQEEPSGCSAPASRQAEEQEEERGLEPAQEQE